MNEELFELHCAYTASTVWVCFLAGRKAVHIGTKLFLCLSFKYLSKVGTLHMYTVHHRGKKS